ncbi:hypothetical protein GCM10025734_17420 [Kitasatospora paranensis]
MSRAKGADEPITYREALRAALREALAADDRVFLMGEDVGRYGGAFGVSLGLLDEFGPERVRDTPCRSRVSSGPASAPPSRACARSSRS